jgi:hypothetical protein
VPCECMSIVLTGCMMTYEIRLEKPGGCLGVDGVLALRGRVLELLNLIHILLHAGQLGKDGMVLRVHPVQA